MGAGYRLEEHGLQFRAVILRVKRFISLQFHQLVVMNENNWSASMHLIHEFGEAGSGLVYGQRFHGFILAPQSMMGNRKKTSGMLQSHLPAVLSRNAKYPLKTSCNGCPVFTST